MNSEPSSDCACRWDEFGTATDFCREHAAALVQRTRDWYQARCGFATGSRIADVVKKTQKGWSEKRYNYLYQLVAERLTGNPQGIRFVRSLEERVELEPEARLGYELYYQC